MLRRPWLFHVTLWSCLWPSRNAMVSLAGWEKASVWSARGDAAMCFWCSAKTKTMSRTHRLRQAKFGFDRANHSTEYPRLSKVSNPSKRFPHKKEKYILECWKPTDSQNTSLKSKNLEGWPARQSGVTDSDTRQFAKLRNQKISLLQSVGHLNWAHFSVSEVETKQTSAFPSPCTTPSLFTYYIVQDGLQQEVR